MSEQIKALQDMINDHARRMSEIEREASALRAKIGRLERIQTAQEQAINALTAILAAPKRSLMDALGL